MYFLRLLIHPFLWIYSSIPFWCGLEQVVHLLIHHWHPIHCDRFTEDGTDPFICPAPTDDGEGVGSLADVVQGFHFDGRLGMVLDPLAADLSQQARLSCLYVIHPQPAVPAESGQQTAGGQSRSVSHRPGLAIDRGQPSGADTNGRSCDSTAGLIS